MFSAGVALAILAGNTGASCAYYIHDKIFQPLNITPLQSDECPISCQSLFNKLEYKSESGGLMSQLVNVVERGEPKSGTGFMTGMATVALAHFCHFLQRAYGQKSCWVEFPTIHDRVLVFQPSLTKVEVELPPCSCDIVER